ncbi:AraC-like DNA-binding protein [Saccharothrix carnea]|uniref:AraC-like DNA-binding protein n=2 Tax=Saccharothrix carnea TaxID=1280637 RepID=A0A2P8I2S2_SACCR|nr:AraC-like DNA-binding protein [Saccharothrix carnea]
MGVVVEGVIERAVGRVIDFMHQNLGEQFTIDDMARTAMYSKFHFSRAFQRVTGVSPGRFLAAIRLQEAKRLLVCTSLAVTDISHRVGYTSVGTFSSRFRSNVGVSPTTYRRLGGLTPPIPLTRRSSEPHTSTVQGEIHAPPGSAPGIIFLGLFPERIPQGKPVRCTMLHRPGPYVITNVPAGTWHLLAHCVALGRELALGEAPYGQDQALNVASCGPVSVRAGARVTEVDLSLRPIGTLDPPVLLALPYIRTVALDAGAAS